MGTFLIPEKRSGLGTPVGAPMPGRILSATALRAVRRERPHAAALHVSAVISADVKACSERRTNAKNFRFGNS
jgi:hypothetical protein